MGLFDNIIGNGAIEEVDPLGMEHITDESNSGTGDSGSSGGTTGTGNGGSTGNGAGGLFGGFSGKKDDSKGQDGSVLIIKNDVPENVQVNTPQEALPVIDVGGIDTNSEIPDIDIGGDMNFGAIIEENNTPIETFSNIENSPAAAGEIINSQPSVSQISSSNQPPLTLAQSPVMQPTSNPIENNNTALPQQQESNSVAHIQDQSMPAGGINSLFDNISKTTPNSSETLPVSPLPIINSEPINIGLISLTEESPKAITQEINANNHSSDNNINILSGLTTGTEVSDINIGNITQIQESPVKTVEIATSEAINETTITELATPTLVSLDTPPEQISPTAINIATDIQKTKESLAERISEFLKELEALKANDEALLKEKQAAIAKLEEAKKPIEEELEKIKADEQRINETIDLLSNIKNI